MLDSFKNWFFTSYGSKVATVYREENVDSIMQTYVVCDSCRTAGFVAEEDPDWSCCSEEDLVVSMPPLCYFEDVYDDVEYSDVYRYRDFYWLEADDELVSVAALLSFSAFDFTSDAGQLKEKVVAKEI